MKNSARAAKNLGIDVVNGFTGSSIWHMFYSFPPVSPETIEKGFLSETDLITSSTASLLHSFTRRKLRDFSGNSSLKSLPFLQHLAETVADIFSLAA